MMGRRRAGSLFSLSEQELRSSKHSGKQKLEHRSGFYSFIF